MAFHLTIGTIGKVRLKNHLTLLLRLNILFSVTRQDCQAHHTEAEEKKKGQPAKVSDIIAIHTLIISGFWLHSSSVSKIQPLKFTTFKTSTSRTSGLWGR
jgi:hypothetical protein